MLKFERPEQITNQRSGNRIEETLFIEETTKPCEVMALEELPSKYATTIMMNMQFGDYTGHTTAIYETIDNDAMKSFMSVMQGKS